MLCKDLPIVCVCCPTWPVQQWSCTLIHSAYTTDNTKIHTHMDIQQEMRTFKLNQHIWQSRNSFMVGISIKLIYVSTHRAIKMMYVCIKHFHFRHQNKDSNLENKILTLKSAYKNNVQMLKYQLIQKRIT